MSIWSDMQDRSAGVTIREEDIHKCTAEVQKSGGAVRIKGFYNLYKDHIILSEEQKQSLRWHEFYIHLKDERFNRWRKYKVCVITPLGNSGESTVQKAIHKVEKKYGYFDGYTCEEVNTEMHKYVTKKNLRMIKEIREDLNRHNMELLGWRYSIVSQKAISAELVQDVYYNSNDAKAFFVDTSKKQPGEWIFFTSGKYKEKSIGIFNVTYERTFINKNKETVTKTSTAWLFAIKGTDVVSTWQELNDKYVKENGDWKYLYDPEGHRSKAYEKAQKSDYADLFLEYKRKIFREYGCKIECE